MKLARLAYGTASALLATALLSNAAQAQLSNPAPGSPPPADRGLSGGKKFDTTGLIDKKNAAAAASSSASGSKSSGAPNMPGGIRAGSTPLGKSSTSNDNSAKPNPSK